MLLLVLFKCVIVCIEYVLLVLIVNVIYVVKMLYVMYSDVEKIVYEVIEDLLYVRGLWIDKVYYKGELDFDMVLFNLK